MTLLVIYQREKWEICEKNLFFLRADQYSYCHAVVKGKPVNLGDGDGMQVLCTLIKTLYCQTARTVIIYFIKHLNCIITLSF